MKIPPPYSFDQSTRWKSRPLLSLMGSSLLLLSVLSSGAHAVTYPPLSDFPEGTPIPPDGSAYYQDLYPLKYRYLPPVGYNPSDTTKLYPLVLFLHGYSEKGIDNKIQIYSATNVPSPALIFVSNGSPNNQESNACFFVAPQLNPKAKDWKNATGQLNTLVTSMIQNFRIDPNRIYITGLSLGGLGVMQQLSAYPTRFAAASPQAGLSNGKEATFKNVPLWAFHCFDDASVSVTYSDSFVSALRAAGGNPIYSRFNTGKHWGSWINAYNPLTPLVPWMFAQRKGQEPATPVGPYVKISSPTTTPDYTTTNSSVNLSGIVGDASASVTSVKWYNAATGTEGIVTGLSNWNATIPLAIGLNQIRIMATGNNYATTAGNGTNTYSDTIFVTRGTPVGGTGLRGSYHTTLDLSSPFVTRIDATVDFDWGTGAPIAGVPVNNFRVVWEGEVQAEEAGGYLFQVQGDDGVWLGIDGKEVITGWVDQGPTNYTTAAPIAFAAGEKKNIRFEMYEHLAGAVARLRWQRPGQSFFVTIPQAKLYPAIGSGTGLKAEYYSDVALTAPVKTQVDSTVNFEWATGSPSNVDGTPMADIGVDNFSVRWTGQVGAIEAGTYVFTTNTDDGVRLWVDNVQVIDKWLPQVPTRWSASVNLAAGQKANIRLEYYERNGGATAQFFWKRPGQTSTQIIPQTQLYPAP